MKIQVLNLSCIALALTIGFFSLHDAHAIQRKATTKPDGECMLSRRYLDEKRVMRFYAQNMLAKEAGDSKKGCTKYCKQAVNYIPESHVSQLNNAITVEYKCQYNSHIHENRQFEHVFSDKKEIKQLTLLKKPKKKKPSVSSYINKGRPAIAAPQAETAPLVTIPDDAPSPPPAAEQENPYAIQPHYQNDTQDSSTSVNDYHNPRRRTRDY